MRPICISLLLIVSACTPTRPALRASPPPPVEVRGLEVFIEDPKTTLQMGKCDDGFVRESADLFRKALIDRFVTAGLKVLASESPGALSATSSLQIVGCRVASESKGFDGVTKRTFNADAMAGQVELKSRGRTLGSSGPKRYQAMMFEAGAAVNWIASSLVPDVFHAPGVVAFVEGHNAADTARGGPLLDVDEDSEEAHAITIAVFDVGLGSGSEGMKIPEALSEVLAVKLIETGRYRVVPRSEIRAQLEQAKLESYDACVDESCQIELGKAVAAEKSVATKLLRVGGTCILSSRVYDLRTETADAARSVRATSCEEEALLDAAEELARQLGTP